MDGGAPLELWWLGSDIKLTAKLRLLDVVIYHKADLGQPNATYRPMSAEYVLGHLREQVEHLAKLLDRGRDGWLGRQLQPHGG